METKYFDLATRGIDGDPYFQVMIYKSFSADQLCVFYPNFLLKCLKIRLR